MILDALPAHVALLDAQGAIIVVNRAWREFALLNLFGGNAGVGENYLEVCDRSFRSGVQEAGGISVGIRDVLAGRSELFEQEYSCHSPAEQRWFRVTVSAIRGEGPAGAVVMHVDVTERHLAEDALKRSEDEHRALIEGSIQGICIHRDFIIQVANPAVVRMFGYASPADLIGRDIGILVAPHEIPRLQPYTAARLRGDAVPSRYELQGVCRDGTLIWIETVVSVVAWKGAPAILATLVDVTDRKRTEEALRQSEEQLRQAQKMEAIGRLAGGVAHDFNNLLTVIIGRSEVLAKALPAHDPLRRQVELIDRTAVRASRLTQQLLAFSRNQVLQPTTVDDVSSMLQSLIGDDVILDIATGAQRAAVKVDRHQLEQAIVNLVINARDAMPFGGRLAIATANGTLDAGGAREQDYPPGPYVILSIADTGLGMPPDVQARAFEPFFTTKGRGQGTGLGLSMVYGFVKQSGGDIAIESESGRGTTVRIYLPLQAGQVSGGRDG